jgi:hypothetical protein
MALPVQNTPIYNLEIPSTKEKFKFRPFLVKEEKALMLAQQSEDVDVMTDTLKSIIESCAKSKIDVDSLATFDLEYIFCQIRAKSVGEVIDLIFSCDDCDDPKAAVKISFDVTTINVKYKEGHEKKIKLFDDVGIVMKYPNIKTLNKLLTTDLTDTGAVTKTIAECIDFIYNSEEVFYAKEQSVEDLVEFINNLTTEQFSRIENFFATMPRMEEPVKYSCPVCKKEHDKILTGLSNFF